jgi:hypothetical protein
MLHLGAFRGEAYGSLIEASSLANVANYSSTAQAETVADADGTNLSLMSLAP